MTVGSSLTIILDGFFTELCVEKDFVNTGRSIPPNKKNSIRLLITISVSNFHNHEVPFVALSRDLSKYVLCFLCSLSLFRTLVARDGKVPDAKKTADVR